jgi:hypothetical protein
MGGFLSMWAPTFGGIGGLGDWMSMANWAGKNVEGVI